MCVLLRRVQWCCPASSHQPTFAELSNCNLEQKTEEAWFAEALADLGKNPHGAAREIDLMGGALYIRRRNRCEASWLEEHDASFENEVFFSRPMQDAHAPQRCLPTVLVTCIH